MTSGAEGVRAELREADEIRADLQTTADLLEDITATLHHDEMPCTDVCRASADLIDTSKRLLNDALDDRDALAARLAQAEQREAQVRALHHRTSDRGFTGCHECAQAWPCPTAAAMNEGDTE